MHHNFVNFTISEYFYFISIFLIVVFMYSFYLLYHLVVLFINYLKNLLVVLFYLFINYDLLTNFIMNELFHEKSLYYVISH